MTGDLVKRLDAEFDEREAKIRVCEQWFPDVRYYPYQLEALRTIQAHRQILGRHEASHHPEPGETAVCICCEEPEPCPDVRSLASIYFPEEAP